MKHLIVLLLLTFFLFGGIYAQNGVIRGRVYDKFSNTPLEFATVLVEGTAKGAYTDSLGNFEIKGLEPNLYNVEARYQGYKSLKIFELQVTNARPGKAEFALEQEAKELDEVEIVASPFNKTEESPVSIRTIGVNEIQRNPGGNRDISRVIQSLPGVATGVAFRNDIIIRGGAPNENRFYLDGIEVPNINHFTTQGASGGPVGLINVDFIREVDFYSGAFPSNRGNTLSSVMEIKQRKGRDDRLGFTATVGSSDLGLTLEGPLGKKTTFLVSGRRSYLQWLFKVLGLPFLPNYNDFQFKTNTKFDEKNELTVIGLGAIDEFSLNLAADSTDEQRYILGYLPVNTQWNYTTGVNFRHFTDNGYWTVVASRNMLNNRAFKYQNNDDSDPDNILLDYTSREAENKFRVENTFRKGGYKLNFGVNYEYAKYTNSTYNKISTPSGPVTIDFDSKLNLQKFGGFAQASRTLANDKLIVSAGIRLDGSDYSKEMANPLRQFSPRVSVAWNFWKNLSLNANSGIYYQLPAYTVLGYRGPNNELTNKGNDISYIRSRHLIGGLEWNYWNSGKITVEGFYKKYDNYPFLLTDSVSLANLGADFGVIGNEPANSTSEGRAYGFEFMAQQKLLKGFFGILTYTFVRSEFTDGQGKYRPSAWDNRHIMTFVGGKKFGKTWEFGGRFRLYGGVPFTPYDLNRSSLVNVWDIRGIGVLDYSQLNSQRGKPYHQLDLRLDKKFFFPKWSLNLYLDIQNIYNFQAEGAPYLDVQRDANGSPIVDPTDPSRYLMNSIQNTSGTVLPTLGVVIQL